MLAMMLAITMAAQDEPPADAARTTWADVAAAGTPLELRDIALWRDGGFRIGTARGRVTRRISSAREDDGVLVRDTASGTYRFAISGAEVGGALAGDCAFGRMAQSVTLGAGWSIDAPGEPLLMHCTFTRNGADAGELMLRGRRDNRGLLPLTSRIGEIRTPHTRLSIASLHAFGARRWPSGDGVGYAFRNEGGAIVGGAGSADFTRRRLSLSADLAQRDAALAAGIALALFWDPGEDAG